MKTSVWFASFILLSTSAYAAQPAASPKAPAAKAATAPAAPAAAPKQQLQEVTYDDLGKYLKQHVVVRTTMRTERSGTLVKYSQTSIDLKLDSGAILTVPRDTIRAIGIPAAPADPLIPATEKK